MPHLTSLTLRVFFAGTMLVQHGWVKFQQFDNLKDQFPNLFGLGSSVCLSLAIFAEGFCSLLLVLGIFTRIMSIPPMITMLVAALVVKAGEPFAQKELAILYFAGFLALFLIGGGNFSLNRFVSDRLKSNKTAQWFLS